MAQPRDTDRPTITTAVLWVFYFVCEIHKTTKTLHQQQQQSLFFHSYKTRVTTTPQPRGVTNTQTFVNPIKSDFYSSSQTTNIFFFANTH